MNNEMGSVDRPIDIAPRKVVGSYAGLFVSAYIASFGTLYGLPFLFSFPLVTMFATGAAVLTGQAGKQAFKEREHIVRPEYKIPVPTKDTVKMKRKDWEENSLAYGSLTVFIGTFAGQHLIAGSVWRSLAMLALFTLVLWIDHFWPTRNWAQWIVLVFMLWLLSHRIGQYLGVTWDVVTLNPIDEASGVEESSILDVGIGWLMVAGAIVALLRGAGHVVSKFFRR